MSCLSAFVMISIWSIFITKTMTVNWCR
jgi:hypothetical protein